MSELICLVSNINLLIVLIVFVRDFLFSVLNFVFVNPSTEFVFLYQVYELDYFIRYQFN